MPGFVDVSDMSAEEIKRLNRADEDSPAPASYSTDHVFAVAAMVWRKLGGYHKDAVYDSTEEGSKLRHQSNKIELHTNLVSMTKPTAADIELGRKSRDYAKGKLLSMLTDSISDYDRKLLEYASAESIPVKDRYALALIASAPSAYDRAEKKRELEAKVAEGVQAYLADIGAAVENAATVLKSNYSLNYGVYFITAITESGYIVFFAHKNNLATGASIRFKGRVKAHRDQYQTQLNRVKVTV